MSSLEECKKQICGDNYDQPDCCAAIMGGVCTEGTYEPVGSSTVNGEVIPIYGCKFQETTTKKKTKNQQWIWWVVLAFVVLVLLGWFFWPKHRENQAGVTAPQ